MDNESDFDFRTLTRDQLERAVENIDGSKFPRNLADARAALAARISGSSPEPVQVTDAAGDARFVRVIEVIIALSLAACATLGIVNDDLWIPLASHYGKIQVVHLHGTSACVGALAIFVFASIPFLGGITDKQRLGILPRFRVVFWAAVTLLLLGFGISWYGQLP